MNHESCQGLMESLSLFVDGEASSQLCAEIERHLAGCTNCRIVVDTLRRTIRLYQQLTQPGIPAQVRERLYKSLDLADYLPPQTRA